MIATIIISFLLALAGLVHSARQTEVAFVIDNTSSMAARKDQLMSAIDDFQKSKIHLLDSRFGLVSFYSETKKVSLNREIRATSCAEIVSPISFAFRDLKRQVRNMRFVRGANMGVKDFFGAVVKSLSSNMHWSDDAEKFIYVITDSPFGFDNLQNPFQSTHRINDGDENYQCEAERYYSEEQFGNIWHRHAGFNLIVVQLQEKYVGVYSKMLDRIKIGAEVKFMVPNKFLLPTQNVLQFLFKFSLFNDHVQDYFSVLRPSVLPAPHEIARKVASLYGPNYVGSQVIHTVSSLLNLEKYPKASSILSLIPPSNIKALDFNKFEILEDPMTYEYYITAAKLMSTFRTYENLNSPYLLIKGYYKTSYAYLEAYKRFYPANENIEYIYRFIRNFETPQLLEQFLLTYNRCLSQIYFKQVHAFTSFEEMLERYTRRFYPNLSEGEKVSFKASVIDYFVENINAYHVCDIKKVQDFFSNKFREASRRFLYKQLALFRIRKYLTSEDVEFDWTTNLHDDLVKPLVEKYLRETDIIVDKQPYVYEMARNPQFNEAIRHLGEAKGIKDFQPKLNLTTFSDGAVQMTADSRMSEKDQIITNYVLESLVGKTVFSTGVNVDLEFFESVIKHLVSKPYFQRHMMFMPDLRFSSAYLMLSKQLPSEPMDEAVVVKLNGLPVNHVNFKKLIQIKDEGEETDYHGFNDAGKFSDDNTRKLVVVQSENIEFDSKNSTIGEMVGIWQNRHRIHIEPDTAPEDLDSRGDVPEPAPTATPVPSETDVSKGITVFSTPSEEVHVTKYQNGEKINLVFKKLDKVENRQLDDYYDENDLDENTGSITEFEVEDLSPDQEGDLDDVYDQRSNEITEPNLPQGDVVVSKGLTIISSPENEEHRIIEQNGRKIDLIFKKKNPSPQPAPKEEQPLKPLDEKTAGISTEFIPPKAEEVQTPKAEEVQTPKAEEVQTPKAEEVQTPKAEEVQAPEAEEVQSPEAEVAKEDLGDFADAEEVQTSKPEEFEEVEAPDYMNPTIITDESLEITEEELMNKLNEQAQEETEENEVVPVIEPVKVPETENLDYSENHGLNVTTNDNSNDISSENEIKDDNSYDQQQQPDDEEIPANTQKTSSNNPLEGDERRSTVGKKKQTDFQDQLPDENPFDVETTTVTPIFKTKPPKDKAPATASTTTSKSEEVVSNNSAVIGTAAAAGVLGLMGAAYTVVKKVWMKPGLTGQEELYDVSGEEGSVELDQAVQINESNYI